MPSHDPEDMSFTVSRDLDRNADDASHLKHLQKAVVHLYKQVHLLQEQNDKLQSQIRERELN
jgi:hypothetical protein